MAKPDSTAAPRKPDWGIFGGRLLAFDAKSVGAINPWEDARVLGSAKVSEDGTLTVTIQAEGLLLVGDALGEVLDDMARGVAGQVGQGNEVG